MSEWQYKKVALNQLSAKTDEIDVLRDVGEQGWELVTIMSNNVAYLKRQVALENSQRPVTMKVHSRDDELGNASEPSREVRPKYRDHVTGETWVGRGRMATWLKRKLDAGEKIENYLISTI